ncbi:MAG: HAMP domain-containing protein [Chloroflexia bacterium]|nr:HAMP domain-containing protein [Chloroflexia bacterium]
MPIRQRIAFSTAGVMVLLLLGLSLGSHFVMSRNLHADMDARLQSVYNAYRQSPSGIGFANGTITINLPELDPFTSPGLFLQVVNTDGVVSEQSATLADQPLAVPDRVLEANANRQDVYYETSIEGTEIRVYSAPVTFSGITNPVAYVQVAESLKPLNETLAQLRNILFFGSLLATIVVGTVAWFLAGAAMRPFAKMSVTAQAIGGADDLSQRLDLPSSGDEVERLAETFNAMLDRLEDAFQAQRRFVADASHELRTPLTALRGNTEIMRRMVASGAIDRDDLLEGLDDVGGEADRLTRLVQDLLTLARADVGWRPEMVEVDLTTIAREAARTAAPLTTRHDFGAEINDDVRLPVVGSADQLKQLLLILLDNALTHTPPGTSVNLNVGADGDQALIIVSDTGSGIDVEHLDHIFERFYRPDQSRARVSGGTGLGLAIARWIAATHGGTIAVTSAPDEGTNFTVRIPLNRG